MSRKREDGPPLGEAWTMIGAQLGLAVEVRGERSIRASGTVQGRGVVVEIDGEAARSSFFRSLFGVNTISSRNQREAWHTAVAVACANPNGTTGSIESSVDVDDPAWRPGHYDPRNGRQVRSDSPDLARRALTTATHEALMSIVDDVRIDVGADALRVDHHGTAIPGSRTGYVAASFLHHFQGDPPPWPQRATVGPPWWIGLLCEMARTLEAGSDAT